LVRSCELIVSQNNGGSRIAMVCVMVISGTVCNRDNLSETRRKYIHVGSAPASLRATVSDRLSRLRIVGKIRASFIEATLLSPARREKFWRILNV
jgi:hypothetical protein